MMNSMTWERASFCCALLGLLAPLAAIAGDEIERTVEMDATGLVSVENLAGSVEFETWDRNAAEIRGESGDQVEKVEISSTAGGVQVRVINRKGGHRVDGTELFLRIPEQASIEAEGVSADLTVSGSRGESISLDTVSGDIEAEANAGRIDFNTVSGDVEFHGTASRSTVETVSGEITLVGVGGEIDAKTVSGDVSLEATEVSRGRFEAVSGDLDLMLALADGGRLSCDSMSGDIDLSLPAGQQAEFTAQSYSGNIHSDFGTSARVSRGPGEMLDYRAGDNGARIRLESFSGDISISSR